MGNDRKGLSSSTTIAAGLDPRIEAYLKERLGDEPLRIARILALGEATDSLIAEKIGQKPSYVRAILYSLYEARLAEYRKVKDKETGWLTFHWKMDQKHALRSIEWAIGREAGALKARIEQGEAFDFSCPVCAEVYSFDKAWGVRFRCPKDEAPLGPVDLARIRRELEAKLWPLTQLLASLGARPV